ncbi:GFA family protein [Lysobacter fragariae]
MAVAATEPGMTTVLEHAGGCHCGRLRWTFATRHSLEVFAPRACDCDFCTRHRAAWVSDPEGKLKISASIDALGRYRQGSGQAEFLLCRQCGVLVAVTLTTGADEMRGAVNRNAFDARDQLGLATPASPQLLGPTEKRERWSRLWMPTELVEAASDT